MASAALVTSCGALTRRVKDDFIASILLGVSFEFESQAPRII